MSTLAGRKVKDTFGNILNVDNANSGIDGTLRYIQDGEGTQSTVQISDSAFNVQSGFQLGGIPVTVSGSELNNLVTQSGTQTLSNKTLTAPIINGVVGGTTTSQTITALTATTINGVAAATAQFTTADETKLDGIEASADVTANATVDGGAF